MTTTRPLTLSQSKEAAQQAVFDAVTKALEEITTNDYALGDQAGRIADLAVAYRLAAGGPQPGGIDISK